MPGPSRPMPPGSPSPIIRPERRMEPHAVVNGRHVPRQPPFLPGLAVRHQRRFKQRQVAAVGGHAAVQGRVVRQPRRAPEPGERPRGRHPWRGVAHHLPEIQRKRRVRPRHQGGAHVRRQPRVAACAVKALPLCRKPLRGGHVRGHGHRVVEGDILGRVERAGHAEDGLTTVAGRSPRVEKLVPSRVLSTTYTNGLAGVPGRKK